MKLPVYFSILLILCSVIAFGAGFLVGAAVVTQKFITLGWNLIEYNWVDITVDKKKVNEAFALYDNQITNFIEKHNESCLQ